MRATADIDFSAGWNWNNTGKLKPNLCFWPPRLDEFFFPFELFSFDPIGFDRGVLIRLIDGLKFGQ